MEHQNKRLGCCWCLRIENPDIKTGARGLKDWYLDPKDRRSIRDTYTAYTHMLRMLEFLDCLLLIFAHSCVYMQCSNGTSSFFSPIRNHEDFWHTISILFLGSFKLPFSQINTLPNKSPRVPLAQTCIFCGWRLLRKMHEGRHKLQRWLSFGLPFGSLRLLLASRDPSSLALRKGQQQGPWCLLLLKHCSLSWGLTMTQHGNENQPTSN